MSRIASCATLAKGHSDDPMIRWRTRCSDKLPASAALQQESPRCEGIIKAEGKIKHASTRVRHTGPLFCSFFEYRSSLILPLNAQRDACW